MGREVFLSFVFCLFFFSCFSCFSSAGLGSGVSDVCSLTFEF